MRWLGALLGLGLALALVGPLDAGQPILFSRPKGEIDVPEKKKEIDLETLSRAFEWKPNSVPLVLPPPQPVAPVRPRWSRDSEEPEGAGQNWLFRDPALFTDKLVDPFKFPKTFGERFFEPSMPFDDTVVRIFGRPARADKRETESTAPFVTPLLPEDPLAQKSDSATRGRLGWRLGEPGDTRASRSDDQSAAKPGEEWSIKSLFEPVDAKAPERVRPGMSPYDMANPNNPKGPALDAEARRREFNRLLDPLAAAPGPGPFDPINVRSDLTRTPINPITPLPSPTVEGPGTPFNLLSRRGPIGPADPLARLTPLEQANARLQGGNPAAPPENKTRQLESLHFMQRPHVIEFPTRKF